MHYNLYKTKLANNLNYLLSLYSMNILELSHSINISYGPLYAISNGKTNPTLDTLLKIAEFFKVNIDDLITLDLKEQHIEKNQQHIEYVPLLDFEQLTQYINTPKQNQSYKKIVFTSHTQYEYIFAIRSNHKLEPKFPSQSILFFSKINQQYDIKKLANTYVLTDRGDNIFSIERLLIQNNNVLLQSIINDTILSNLDQNISIIAYLIQSRFDF